MLDTVAFDCPIVVDNMGDTTNKAYAGMPIRLFILKGRNVEYAGGVGPTFYNLNEVKEWLQSYSTTNQKNTRHRAQVEENVSSHGIPRCNFDGYPSVEENSRQRQDATYVPCMPAI